jgi:hypothetical protein
MNHLKRQQALSLAIASTLLCGIAVADPPHGSPASCMGFEAADVSPPGSEDGPFSQFGMPGILEFMDGIAAAYPGVFRHRGDVISAFAQIHAGSHHDCDEAVGIPPGSE